MGGELTHKQPTLIHICHRKLYLIFKSIYLLFGLDKFYLRFSFPFLCLKKCLLLNLYLYHGIATFFPSHWLLYPCKFKGREWLASDKRTLILVYAMDSIASKINSFKLIFKADQNCAINQFSNISHICIPIKEISAESHNTYFHITLSAWEIILLFYNKHFLLLKIPSVYLFYRQYLLSPVPLK